MGWVRKNLGIKEWKSDNLWKAAAAVAAIYGGGTALGMWGGGAGAGAGAAGAAGTGLAAGGATAAELGALGSGMYGAVGGSALGELGALGSMGLGAGTAAASGATAAGLGSVMGGMTAAELFASNLPALGSTVAGGASGALGSGLWGSGILDIGRTMGTVGGAFGDAASSALGSGLFGLGDLGTIQNGGFLGDVGIGGALPKQAGNFGGNLWGDVGSEWVNAAGNANISAPYEQVGDPYANETAKLARQNAQQPGSYWEQNLKLPSQPSPLQRIAERAGKKLLTDQIKAALLPQPQGMPQRAPLPPATPFAPPSTQQQSNGALSQVTGVQGAPQPMGMYVDPAQREWQREMRDRRYGTDDTNELLTWQDFVAQNALQGGNNTATLSGIELWKALNQQNNKG